MNRSSQSFRCTGVALGVLLALVGSAAAQTLWPTPAYLSPDGKLVLVQVEVEKNKYKWAVCDSRTGKQVVLLEGIAAREKTGLAYPAVFSPDGKSLLFQNKLWDIATGKAGPRLDKSVDYGRAVFSPDGKMLVTFDTVDLDQLTTVRLRDAVTLELKAEWSEAGHVAFSARGGRLALVALIKKMPTLIVVETATGKQVAAHELPGVEKRSFGVNHGLSRLMPSATLALSADGQLVAVVRKNQDRKGIELAILKVADGKPVALLPSQGWNALAVAFSPDGKTLAAGGASDGKLPKGGDPGGYGYFFRGSDGEVTLWDTATWQRRTSWIEERGRVHTLHFAPDGVLVAHVILPGNEGLRDTRYVCLRDPANGRELAAVHVRRDLVGINYRAVTDVSEDGRIMIVSSRDEAMLVDLGAAPRQVAMARKHVGAVMGLAFSPDGTWLASAGADRTVRLWQAASLKQHAVLTGHRGTVLAVAFAPKDPWLASAGADGFLRLWEVPEGKALHALRAHGDAPVSCVAFAADGTLASGGFDGLVKLWDAAKGEAKATLTPEVDKKAAKPSPIASLAFSRDAARLAVGIGEPIWLENSHVEIWDVSRRERKSRWPGPVGLRGLAFGADADALFVAGTLIEKESLPGPGAVELRQSNSGKTAKVVRSLRQEHTFQIAEGMLCVAVSPNGKVLAAGSGAPTVRGLPGQLILADAADLKLLPGLMLPAGVSAVALSSDGRLAVADVEGVIRMYQLNPAQGGSP